MLRCQGAFLLLILLSCSCMQVLAGTVTDTTALPSDFRTALDQYRQDDDLTAWLYARIDYAEAAPAARIRFLMDTQKETWRSYRTLPERQAWFNLLILQGYNLLQTGNMLASIQAYERAMEFFDAYPIADTDEYVDYVLKPLGNNYTRLADYDAALYIHQKTLQVLEKADNEKEMAGVYANIATCARWKGDLNTAAVYCLEGLIHCDEQSALHGLLLNTYADVLLQQNKTDSALYFSTRALARLKHWTASYKTEPQSLNWYIAALQLNARLLLAMKQPQAARLICREATELHNRHYPATRPREKAKMAVLTGDILLQGNQQREAMEQYQLALLQLLPSWKPAKPDQMPPDSLLYSENTITDALAGKAAALAAMQYRELALEHYFAVFRAAHKLRAAFSYTDSKLRDMQLLRERSEAAMDLAFGLYYKTPASNQYRNKILLITELSKAQVLQDERMIRWQQGTNKKNTDSLFVKRKRLQEAVIYYQHEMMDARGADKANYQSLLQTAEYELALLNKKNGQQSDSPEMLTVAALQRMYEALPKGTDVFSFFNGKKNSYRIRFNNSGVSDIALLKGEEFLRTPVLSFVTKWFGNGPGAMINEPLVYGQESVKIYGWVFGKPDWHAMERCILLPDGIFSYIPFDALCTGHMQNAAANSWPLLFKEVKLSQAWSFQTWYDQQQTKYAPGNFAAWFVAKSNNQSLPELSVDKEMKWLQGQIPGKYYSNESATWSAFQQQIDSASILHIGTHAVAAPDEAFPYLQLYDQPFYLFDLRYKHFAPSLVWLGACRTGEGELVEGEGMNSLSRAFAAAGAGGVVAGMWNVNDAAATEIMELFYQQLGEGEDAAMALHKAKEQYLSNHKDNQVMQLPYYWAGYTYSGHLQPVTLPGKLPAIVWVIAAFSCILLFLFFWWFFKKIYK